MTTPLNAWRLTGQVFLWRFPDNARNYPGWHVSATAAGARSVLDLLSLFEAAERPVYRTLSIAAPTEAVLAVPNASGGRAPVWSPLTWRIRFEPAPEHGDLWEFPRTNPAVLSLGRRHLVGLVTGITGILHGTGDYSIGTSPSSRGAESTGLSFWWLPSGTPVAA